MFSIIAILSDWPPPLRSNMRSLDACFADTEEFSLSSDESAYTPQQYTRLTKQIAGTYPAVYRTVQTNIWNAKLTYIQIFVPRFKYLYLCTNGLYLGTNI